MLRVWMLLVVGAAAMRQVAEDALAHSAVKEEWSEKSLRKAVKKVAKENFNENERHYLKKAVMKAFKNGELDKGLKEMSGKEKQRYLLTTMQQMQDLRSLRSAAEEVAKKNFPEMEQRGLTEAVMKAFKSGELDKGLKEMSWEEKQRYLLTTMQTMREEYLRSAAEEVAKRFPEKEQHHLTEAVMEAFKNGELDQGRMFYDHYLRRTMGGLRELPVAASAVKFCSNLFREANSEAVKSMDKSKPIFENRKPFGTRREHLHRKNRKPFETQQEHLHRKATNVANKEAKEAARICHKVLTGELGADDGPEWAEKAANSSQPEGQHYQLGRLQKVNATETAWKVSLDNVCKDECIELVKEMKKEALAIVKDVAYRTENPPSYEEVCAKRVVQKVEAEILGCCAESCGWNGRACMYWPFLSSTEKGQWEAECCTEFNILKNSSRATMCDATLTGKESEEVIRDGQPNRPKDRRMIGQDPVGKGTSFLQEEDTNGPNPPPENTPIPPYEGTCPDPLNLGKEHSKLKGEWKTTNYQEAKKNHFKKGYCLTKPPNVSIGNCTAFLPQGVDGKYVCYGHCLGSVDGLVFTNLTDTVPPSVNQLLYVHKSISGE